MQNHIAVSTGRLLTYSRAVHSARLKLHFAQAAAARIEGFRQVGWDQRFRVDRDLQGSLFGLGQAILARQMAVKTGSRS